jgi:HSP20 family protein
MPKDKNLINKLMGTQNISEDEDAEESEEIETTQAPEGASEEWLSEYEGQLTIDMYQTKDNVIIKSTIAGVRPEDIDVTIANDMVTIRGERKRDFEASSEDYFYQECYWGSFSRSVVLPVDVDIENVSADLKDGILTVVLPKAAKARAKKVKVGARA